MKNLKKYLAVLVAITMMITTLVPALAAEPTYYSAEATKLNTLGLYKGISTSTFDPALDLNVDRETGVVLALRILGLEGTAISNYDGEDGNSKLETDLANCADVNSISEWAKEQVAYAIKIGMIKGERIAENGQFYFNPEGPLTGNAFATIVLRSLGYEGSFDYDGALAKLIDISSSANKISNASDWAKTSLTRNQLVGLTYYLVLAAKFAPVEGESEITVIQNLLDTNQVTWDQIQSIGLIADLGNVVTEPIAISSVTASRVVDESGENTHNQLTVVFSEDIGPTPVPNNFKITRSTQGNESLMQDEVIKVDYESGANTAILHVTPTTPDNDDQIITYSVMYKGGTAVTATLTDLVVKSVSNIDSNHIKVVFNQEVDKATAKDIHNYTGLKDVEVTSVVYGFKSSNTVLESDNKTVILELTAADVFTQENKTYELIIKNVKNSDLSKTITESTKRFFSSTNLNIYSVSTTNLKQVNVMFNQEVDKATAETVANYSIPDITIDSAVLQADNKTVVLNLNSETILSQNTNYTLTINNVKNSDSSKEIANDTAQEFKAQDNANPTVKSVEVLGTKGLRVVFSEPIKTVNAEAFSFSGEAGTTVSSLTHNAGTDDWTTVILKLDSALAAGTHALSIAGNSIQDFADKYLESVDVSFEVTEDTTMPAVQNVELLSSAKVQVTFNKSVQNVTKSNISWFYNSGVGTGIMADNIIEVDEKTYIADFTSTPVPNDAYVTVTASGINGPIEDYSGNTVSSDYSTLYSISANIPTTTKLVVKFNKPVDNTTATSVSNYTLLKEGGVTAISLPTPELDSSNTMVTFKLSTSLPSDNYILTISGIKDESDIEMLQQQTINLKTPAKMLDAALIDPTHIDLLFDFPVQANNTDLQKSIIVKSDEIQSIGFKLVDADGNEIDNVTAKIIHLKLNNWVDITDSLKVKTTPANWINLRDENNNFVQVNTTGFEAATDFKATRITTTTQTINDVVLEKLVIKFNKNIDLTTIKSGWLDAEEAQNGRLDFQDGKMVIQGTMSGETNIPKLGEIVGFDSTGSYESVITSDGLNTITIAATRSVGTQVIFAIGDEGLTYSPDAVLKNLGGASINTNYKPFLEAPFKATSITTTTQTIGNSELPGGEVVLEQLVIKFNKNIDLTTIKQSWTDAEEAQNITLIFNENGELSTAGTMPGETILLGVIKGFTRKNFILPDNADIQPVLTSDGLNTIKISITRQSGTESIFAIGDNGLIYSPDAGLKSAEGKPINPSYTPVLEVREPK